MRWRSWGIHWRHFRVGWRRWRVADWEIRVDWGRWRVGDEEKEEEEDLSSPPVETTPSVLA
jgi:hypothetical protein